jgi:hypothetical protein
VGCSAAAAAAAAAVAVAAAAAAAAVSTSLHEKVIAHSSTLVGSYELSSVASGDVAVWARLSRRHLKDLPAGEGWQPVLLLLLLLPLLQLLLLLLLTLLQLLLLLCRPPRTGR